MSSSHHPARRRSIAAAVAAVLLLAACSDADDGAGTSAGEPTAVADDPSPDPTITTPTALPPGSFAVLEDDEPAHAAAFDAARTAILLTEGDTWAAAAALPLAAREEAPAVVADATAVAAFADLGVERVVGVGSLGTTVGAQWEDDGPDYEDLRTDDPASAALAIADEVEPDLVVTVPPDDWFLALYAAAAAGDAAVVAPAGPAVDAWLADHDDVRTVVVVEGATPAEVTDQVHAEVGTPPAQDSAWLLDPSRPRALPALVTAVARGGTPVLRDPRDLRLGPVPEPGRFPDDVPTVAVGAVDPTREWQWRTAATGVELPGGGQVLFPGRRLVALYGNHVSRGLGVLGEQGPEASVERARELAALYDDGTLPVVPSFEMIATVASASAGEDGDYSAEGDVDAIREWVDVAEEAGIYVVLDLQPGRATYLSQAQRYEELLLRPHVGLALDPEWRLRPDQVHLRQIGSVHVDEVNEVAAWLAELTREHLLPQKLFIIHQFNLAMIRGDRAAIVKPPELAVMIHMDGQGGQGAKDGTYRRVVEAPGEFWWGWKNFYDEDLPSVRSPAATLAVDPQPVFISYQ